MSEVVHRHFFVSPTSQPQECTPKPQIYFFKIFEDFLEAHANSKIAHIHIRQVLKKCLYAHFLHRVVVIEKIVPIRTFIMEKMPTFVWSSPKAIAVWDQRFLCFFLSQIDQNYLNSVKANKSKETDSFIRILIIC